MIRENVGDSEGVDWILGVLDLLGRDAARQAEYLQTTGTGVDELALLFEDAYNLAQAKRAPGVLDQYVVDSLSCINDILNRMTDAANDSWSLEALDESQDWASIRRESNNLAYVIRQRRA